MNSSGLHLEAQSFWVTLYSTKYSCIWMVCERLALLVGITKNFLNLYFVAQLCRNFFLNLQMHCNVPLLLPTVRW